MDHASMHTHRGPTHPRPTPPLAGGTMAARARRPCNTAKRTICDVRPRATSTSGGLRMRFSSVTAIAVSSRLDPRRETPSRGFRRARPA
ncbi:uncharacterized protein TRAVEDRAFT_59737 [Trametes versicolor FP-101664 SS1]|uniref:uncharacterized protein n=1 Tax=Trametes versicolor (strain FP-101664) TaxID=717944 RepID=UPI00046246AD|nr:uncharacterized protein TRAVEDRAFT_59737 [Trametes versicolor FP-101664 SS1]EIW56901.1 hypothetical protein TRAVEDRAFT_59737 [Trametes versicolor FP-101664 SS1]